MTQVTDYPWDGNVKIQIDKLEEVTFAMHIRIPRWTENATVIVNGKRILENPISGKYLKIERTWKEGDEIVLDFPMPVQLMEANPKVLNFNNKVAIMRGPIVYCLELPKTEGGEEIFNKGVFLAKDIELVPEYRDDFLGGVTVLKGLALNRTEKENLDKKSTQLTKSKPGWKEHELYRPMKLDSNGTQVKGSVEIELIPYYAWANRGLSYMDVWIPLAR